MAKSDTDEQGTEATEAAAAEEPSANTDAFAIYHKDAEGGWSLVKTYTTHERGIAAFTKAGLPDDVQESRLMQRVGAQPWPPTLYGHEVEAQQRIAQMAR